MFQAELNGSSEEKINVFDFTKTHYNKDECVCSKPSEVEEIVLFSFRRSIISTFCQDPYIYYLRI